MLHASFKKKMTQSYEYMVETIYDTVNIYYN